ncbi:phage terminase small subunit P27 family [Qipengyuania sediminis]|uniref:phage terminase small subunit P27 family n=1 Tax=Qipengyuania sediminis TaxID=1532023 RepID=UPI001404C716|nr:phage terminase small subunit P27 family [Qipengyuania sediminis]
MGRQRKPTHLRIVEGTLEGKFGKGRAKKQAREPIPKGYLAVEDCPADFSTKEREIWRQAVTNSPYGMLRKLDGAILRLWCVAFAIHARAHRSLEASSTLIVKTPNGAVAPNPYLSIMNRQTVLMKALAAELGFSPAARSKIFIEEQEEEYDPTDRFFS